MREIIFRGKRKDNGEWIQGSLFTIWDKSYIIIGMVYPDVPNKIEVIPDTVGQYIGQDDKNGTKIFDGDIIVMEYCERVCLVAFDGSSFGYKSKYCLEHDIPSYPFDDSEFGHFTSEFEIIGNIHDNPQLLYTKD